MPIETLDETARQILDAATKRFLHYGYGKTTMSEIASDCNMSTGNLYRYFPSKLDIAETFVRVLRSEQIELLKQSIETPASPAQKLRTLLHAKFRLAYERFHDRPKAYELATEVLLARPEVAVEWEEAEEAVIAGIVSEGERSGAFAVGESARTPRLIQDAVFRFTTPAVFHEGDCDSMASELDALIDFMLDALTCRAGKAAMQHA
ncbi:MAG: TetR/AcrR family transcriptional regulator [Amphiplicatus sp.]